MAEGNFIRFLDASGKTLVNVAIALNPVAPFADPSSSFKARVGQALYRAVFGGIPDAGAQEKGSDRSLMEFISATDAWGRQVGRKGFPECVRLYAEEVAGLGPAAFEDEADPLEQVESYSRVMGAIGYLGEVVSSVIATDEVIERVKSRPPCVPPPQLSDW